MKKTALLLGATGLVGEQCLRELAKITEYDKIIVLSRKKIALPNSKFELLISDFTNIDLIGSQLNVTDIFCALGTTISKAGSAAEFKRVDYDIPMQLAKHGKSNGAKQFVLVSSIGANAQSSVLYTKTKGKLEADLAKLNFECLLIFRPSILLGDRKENRVGETVGKFIADKLDFLFVGPLKKYRGTPANLLAKVMVSMAQKSYTGVRIIDNEEILALQEK